jgi:HEAT repeat protein
VGLAKLNTPEAAKALRWAAEKGKRPGIRRFAAKALETSAVTALAAELRRPERAYHYYAAMALYFLNAPAARPALVEAQKDRRADVRSTARQAIRRLNRAPAEGRDSCPSPYRRRLNDGGG